MKRYQIVKISLLILAALFYHCALQPPPGQLEIPYIRVGIMEGQTRLEFLAETNFNVDSDEGAFLSSGSAGDRCEVTVIDGHEAAIRYQLEVKTFFDEQSAQNSLQEVISRGLPAKIKKRKQRLVKEGTFGSFITYQVCLEQTFASEENANKYRSEISNIQFTTVNPYIQTLPAGRVRLKNLRTGKVSESKNYLRVSGDGLTLEVKTGAGYHFEKTETRTYGSRLNFVVDLNGKLTLVNELPLEQYLYGVVASEMHADFPTEAVKAQAITARSYTLARINKQHALDPFDVCDEVHCQVYGGITRASANTITAVNETAGKVLMYEKQICETFYLAVCGGHTEHNENVWQGAPKPYLRGQFDLPQDKVTVEENFLLKEENVRIWLEKNPNVYCNVYLMEDLPSYLEYTRKYFRWTVEYTQAELKDIIRKKTGENIGNVLDIIPIERGISGRLIKIMIKGTDKILTVEKELEIRKALSANYLYSSCFQVDKANITNGIPQKFIIKGAGWGHGVGMCQTGAAIMALRGKTYKEILNHYYRGAKITALY